MNTRLFFLCEVKMRGKVALTTDELEMLETLAARSGASIGELLRRLIAREFYNQELRESDQLMKGSPRVESQREAHHA